MENEDDMIEGIQDMEQVEAVPEVAAEEVAADEVELEAETETEASEEQQEPGELCDEDGVAEDPSRPSGSWEKVKEFVKKRRLPVLYAVIALVAVLVVLFVIQRNRVGKNRYESLVQTITEMKRISEFCTANYIGEVMIQDEENHFLNHKNIVLIVRGKIRMGYDLSKMETEVVDDSTINLMLPQAQILDIITNPSDIRTFSEKGHWSHERVTITKNSARAKLLELVMEENLLATAEDNGIRQLTALFSSFGFKHVNITFVADSIGCEVSDIVGDSVSSNATTLFTN